MHRCLPIPHFFVHVDTRIFFFKCGIDEQLDTWDAILNDCAIQFKILGEKLKAVVFKHTPGVSGGSDNMTDFAGVEVEVKYIAICPCFANVQFFVNRF